MTLKRNQASVLVVIAGITALMLACGLSCMQSHDLNAPRIIQLPTAEKLTLQVTAVPADGKLGVGVRLMADNKEAGGLSQDGKPVQVQMVVADASGIEKASKVGTLADFGFS